MSCSHWARNLSAAPALLCMRIRLGGSSAIFCALFRRATLGRSGREGHDPAEGPAARLKETERSLRWLAAVVIFNVVLSTSFQTAMFLTNHKKPDIPLAMLFGSLLTALTTLGLNYLLRKRPAAGALRIILLTLGGLTAVAATWNLKQTSASTFVLYLLVEIATTVGVAATWTYFQAPLEAAQIRWLRPDSAPGEHRWSRRWHADSDHTQICEAKVPLADLGVGAGLACRKCAGPNGLCGAGSGQATLDGESAEPPAADFHGAARALDDPGDGGHHLDRRAGPVRIQCGDAGRLAAGNHQLDYVGDARGGVDWRFCDADAGDDAGFGTVGRRAGACNPAGKRSAPA